MLMLREGLLWLIVWRFVIAAGEILQAECAWSLLWDLNEIWHSHESPYLSTWHQLVTAVLALPQGHPPVLFTPVSLLLMGRPYTASTITVLSSHRRREQSSQYG